jgi:hypothetical protein
MAVTATAGTAVANEGVTNANFTVPATSAGDVTVVQVVVNCGTAAVTTPAGWSVLIASHQPTNTTAAAMAVFYRAWQSGDPSTVNVTWAASGRFAIIPSLVSGASTSTFSEATATAALGNVTGVDAPTVTASSSRFLMTFYGLRTTDTTNAASSFTTPTGMTELGDIKANVAAANATSVVASQDYEVLGAAGATGVRTATATASGQGLAASALILPAVAASPWLYSHTVTIG